MKKLFFNIFNIIIVLVLLGFFSSCDKEVSVTPPEPPPPTGKLFVDSDPQGAFIYLDGKNSGNITPDTIEWLEEKEYLLTLKKRLFKTYSVSIRVTEDSLTSFFLNYHTANGIYGRMIVDSKPREVEIFLNGVSTGQYTKTTIENLFPGTYNVKFKLSGYWDDSLSVEVRSEHTAHSFLTLIDSTVWVNFKESNSGLPDDFINHVAIEDGGIKWIATKGSGLVKYDDNDWTLYNTSNSPLPTDDIKFIAIGADGVKWLATSVGLIRFDNFNWTVYDVSNSQIPSDMLTTIAAEDNSDIWIGTFDAGIVKLSSGIWTVYNTVNSEIKSNVINTIAIDEIGNKWIGTYNAGIAKFTGNSWTIFDDFNNGDPVTSSSISFENSGTVWISIRKFLQAPGGSAFFDGVMWNTFHGLPSSDVLYVAVDQQNNKWFANESDGLSKYDGSFWTNFTTSNSKLPSNRLSAIAIDGAGNKWLTTFGGGLVKYKGN